MSTFDGLDSPDDRRSFERLSFVANATSPDKREKNSTRRVRRPTSTYFVVFDLRLQLVDRVLQTTPHLTLVAFAVGKPLTAADQLTFELEHDA
jgi:hypothetical protein